MLCLGIMQNMQIDHCNCKSKAVTLVHLGFWPLSPNTPHTAISMDLMEMYRLLCMEGQISLQAFCSAVQMLNEGNIDHVCIYLLTWLTVTNNNTVIITLELNFLYLSCFI